MSTKEEFIFQSLFIEMTWRRKIISTRLLLFIILISNDFFLQTSSSKTVSHQFIRRKHTKNIRFLFSSFLLLATRETGSSFSLEVLVFLYVCIVCILGQIRKLSYVESNICALNDYSNWCSMKTSGNLSINPFRVAGHGTLLLIYFNLKGLKGSLWYKK